MSTLEDWLQAACAELGIDPAGVDLRALLDLTRDVARAVDRPAAPVTAYLLGIAVGRGTPAPEAAARVAALAQSWADQQPGAGQPPT